MAQTLTKKMALVTAFAIFFTLIDRLLKIFALTALNNKSLTILPDFFNLTLAKNTGIAFSLPFSGLVLNITIIAIILGLLFSIISYYNENRYSYIFCLLFVLFGAISNLTDRILYNSVIDYFDLKYFTIFNIADIMIVGGIFLFILQKFKNKES